MNLHLLLAAAPSDYATLWWPLWPVWLIAVLALLFAGRPTRARRILGVAWLGLGLSVYSWALYVWNGCIEGYADWTSCDVAGTLMPAGVALMLIAAVLALSSPNRQ